VIISGEEIFPAKTPYWPVSLLQWHYFHEKPDRSQSCGKKATALVGKICRHWNWLDQDDIRSFSPANSWRCSVKAPSLWIHQSPSVKTTALETANAPTKDRRILYKSKYCHSPEMEHIVAQLLTQQKVLAHVTINRRSDIVPLKCFCVYETN